MPSHMEVSFIPQVIFIAISSANNFDKLPFPHGLKLRTHISYRTVNHAITIMFADRAE